MALIIDGKKIRDHNLAIMKKEVEELNSKNIYPCLCVIIVGNDPASRVYVNNKKKACENIGILSREYALPTDTETSELLALIDKLNNDEEVSGILCQLPLPVQIEEKTVLERISPEKDVDCFHPYNVGKLVQGDAVLKPCTPNGIITMLDYMGYNIEGKNCVVIGRSNIVGKPMAQLLMERNGTVTVCHKKTVDLKNITSRADLIVSSVGKPKFLTADMVGEGAVVIDVGMNRDENGNLCGDAVYDEVEKKASMITPVPGGVGPMTITMLMKNTILAEKNKKLK